MIILEWQFKLHSKEKLFLVAGLPVRLPSHPLAWSWASTPCPTPCVCLDDLLCLMAQYQKSIHDAGHRCGPTNVMKRSSPCCQCSSSSDFVGQIQSKVHRHFLPGLPQVSSSWHPFSAASVGPQASSCNTGFHFLPWLNVMTHELTLSSRSSQGCLHTERDGEAQGDSYSSLTS